jgi:2-hydroxycyclohexanecarboxyl-CoA dehydrogenase
LGNPDDYGDVVLFLASDLARFVTGTSSPSTAPPPLPVTGYGRADGRGWTNLPDQP